MEKELAPMNIPQFFSLLLGLTIIYQQYWVHPARPKPQETIPSGHFQMDPVIVPYLFHRWHARGFLLSHPLGFAYFVCIHFTPGQKQNHPAYLFICVDLTFFSPYGSEGGALLMCNKSGLPIMHHGCCPILVYKEFRMVFFSSRYQGINNKKIGKKLQPASCN